MKRTILALFENYVNYAGSKTDGIGFEVDESFENYVNYAGSKTYRNYQLISSGLRTM